MLKLTPKMARNATSRHSGNLRAVVCEALEERQSKDPDLDKSRTKYNTYEGIRSGYKLVDEMMLAAQEYSKKRQAAGGRALRDTAAIGFATIIKPDEDAINAMTPEEQDRFFRDSNEILDKLFGSDNIKSRVRHNDEKAPHEHTFRVGYTPEGKLEVAYYFKPQLWGKINREYPKLMRERHWDVSDCDVYDASKEDDPEYIAARKAKRKNYGRSSKEYKADMKLQEVKEKEEKMQKREEIVQFREDAVQRHASKTAHKESELKTREEAVEKATSAFEAKGKDIRRTVEKAARKLTEAVQSNKDDDAMIIRYAKTVRKKDTQTTLYDDLLARAQKWHMEQARIAAKQVEQQAQAVAVEAQKQAEEIRRRRERSVSGLRNLEENLEAEKRQRYYSRQLGS